MLSSLDSASLLICLIFNTLLVGTLSAIMLTKKKYADDEEAAKRPLLDKHNGSIESIDVGGVDLEVPDRLSRQMATNISAIGGSNQGSERQSMSRFGIGAQG